MCLIIRTVYEQQYARAKPAKCSLTQERLNETDVWHHKINSGGGPRMLHNVIIQPLKHPQNQIHLQSSTASPNIIFKKIVPCFVLLCCVYMYDYIMITFLCVLDLAERLARAALADPATTFAPGTSKKHAQRIH